MITNIILASGSPRRRELLAGLGWHFTVEPSEAEEKIFASESPAELVERLSSEKAFEVARRRPGFWVIGADTVVAVDGEILGKPKDRGEAFLMLKKLQGRSHSVFTGVSVIAEDCRCLTAHEETRVCFRELTDEELNAYLDCGESMDKAGAYAIQEKGTLLVTSIEGDYFNVAGLPLVTLSRLFEKLGISLSEQWRTD